MSQPCPLCGEPKPPESLITDRIFSTFPEFPKPMLYAIAAGVPIDVEIQADGRTAKLTTRYPVAIRYDRNGAVISVKVPQQ